MTRCCRHTRARTPVEVVRARLSLAREASAGGSEAGVALILVMLLILIMSTISLTALGLALHQVVPTQDARKNVQTINTANAGLQAGLGLLRSATVAGAGNIARLPCTSDGAVITGPVEGSTDGDTYRTRIRYFAKNTDPTGQSSAWLDANDLSCPLTQVPFFALLENAGNSTALPVGRAQRSLRATYTFSTSNVNSTGGRIMDGSGSLCWDVGATPAVGTVVTYQPCLAAGAPRQTWTYRASLDLYWAGGTTTSNLCLDYRTYNVSSATPTAVNMTLQSCYNAAGSPGSTYPYSPRGEQYQEFASHSQWWAVEDNGDRSFNDCIGTAPGALTAGAAVMMRPNDNCTNLRPENAVGAGAAAGTITGLPGPTQQLVNYQEFGQCLDVQGSLPSNGYLIAYPCHQAPDPALVEGNQRFVFSGVAGGSGTLTSTRAGFYATMCMTSPTTPGTTDTPPSCCATAGQQWTFAGVVSGDYDSSYTIRDSTGRCLGLANPNGSTGGYKFASMQPCDGTDGQKWNAPPGTRPQAVTGVVETTGQTS